MQQPIGGRSLRCRATLHPLALGAKVYEIAH